MSSEYEREALRLSKLSRAERFDELLSFPTRFSFKAIGRGDDFGDIIKKLLITEGYGEVVLMERPSKKGNYISVTFTLEMVDGAAIDTVYKALESLDELAYLL